MSLPLLIVGGFLLVLGSIIFIVDAFKIHWGWGLSVLFIPFANLVCVIKHWASTKRGFLLTLLALPFLGGGFFTMPKAGAKPIAGKAEKISDPFYNAMQRARDAVSKVQDSRKEAPGAPVVPFVPAAPVVALNIATPPATAGTALAPVLTVTQRLANNRTAFKNLETQFGALNAKRKALPKNDSKAIAVFNLEAKDYADKLAETRSEQAILLELQRMAQK